MAIKGKKAADVVSVYDPALKANHEVAVEDLEKSLSALGFSKDEIDAKIRALQEPKEE